MIRILFLSFLIFFISPLHSQKSLTFDNPDITYEKGLELYRLGKFGLARVQFSEYALNQLGISSARVAEAEYLSCVCSQRLDNEDVLFLWNEYIKNYAYSNRLTYAQMHIGDYYKDKGKYRQAVRSYEKVDGSNLDKNTQIEFYFSAGYANFMEESYDQALLYFNNLKGKNHKYDTSVKYFYSHIQYVKESYQTALDGFIELEDKVGFTEVVPFYIAQIYYLQGDYENAVLYAKPLVKDGNKVRQADMNRIVADSYYALNEYKNALPFYAQTIKLSTKPKREDYFHQGFANYHLGHYTQAIEGLSQVTSSDDVMSQSAYYHLGDCYLKIDDKKRARVAFEAASKFEYDKDIQEDALFNYIKLNYELAFSPFNEIINSFLSYIELFPESDKIDQAYDYLGKAFLTTKNYKEALASMEKIESKAPGVYRGIQRIAYYRGLELFTDTKYGEAIEFFDYSLKYGDYDKKLKVSAYYWRGESYYRTRNYSKAIEDYRAFIYMPGSYQTEEFQLAHYNMAYAYFKQKSYADSQSWFRKYLNIASGNNAVMIADANNRTGDCYYVERDFTSAINYYNRAAGMPQGAADYAMFQKSFCLGLQKDYSGKIEILNTLIKRYPKSPYVDDALYEMGRSYVSLGNLDKAIFHFKTIKERYPKGSFAKKAMLQLGLVYYNDNDNANSLAFYKRIVNEFPGTPEAEDALIGIRNIYMDKSDLNGYIQYTEDLGGFARMDLREQDSLSFVAAERFYMKNDCEHAIKHFISYLNTYPNGKFVLNAHFYKADCQYRNGETREALSSYDYVVNKGRSFFTEEALLRSGELLFREEKYGKALEMFKRLENEAEIESNRLESKIGNMRCLLRMKKYMQCIEAADVVLKAPKIGDEIKREAIYKKATSSRYLNEYDDALVYYTELAVNTKSAEGAESKYWLAQMLKDQNNDELAEKEVFDYINKGTSHQYWLARSFILLAEIYHDRGESFQAIQYLQSIKDNYQGDDDVSERVNRYLKEWGSAAEKPAKNDSIANN